MKGSRCLPCDSKESGKLRDPQTKPIRLIKANQILLTHGDNIRRSQI